VTTERKIYFQAGGKLSFNPPTDSDDNAHDAYVADPAKPVPYRARPIPSTFGPNSTWGSWLVDDQRHADHRPDVLSWESEALTDDIVVSGHILANLFLSTTGTDGDWVVKLIDVYPEDGEGVATMGGYQLMVANEVMRARFRNGWDKPEPLVAGQTFPLTVDMRNMNHRFKKGHRIMVQVQSSWFPLIDRNPQTFVPTSSRRRKATSRRRPSGSSAPASLRRTSRCPWCKVG
jgi:putative CocE/NonD family hydrolase